MPIKVLVNGAFGRMGQMIVKSLSLHPSFELVGQAAREYDLKKVLIDSGAQVVIDFTHPDSVFKNTEIIIESGVHPVIGTSGLTLDEVALLQAQAAKAKLGGIIAPNFSLGAVLMMKYAKEIARYMPHVEVIEMHHDGKVDSPSGTAIRTAEILGDAIASVKNPPTEKETRETVPGARGARHHGVAIHSLRLPGALAHQEIIFGSLGETLSMRHDTIDRLCFMPGICLACEKVLTLDRLIYGLEEII